jgi:glycosyltransferase involved in cell wall biosynthesis
MRILELTDFYPPFIGGLERHVQMLSQDLVARGHEVAVATMELPDTPPRENDEGVQVHRMTGWQRALTPLYQRSERPFHPPTPDPGVVRQLRRLLGTFRPDVVHAHSWLLYSMLPLARAGTAALVVTTHDYGFICAKKTMMRQGTLCSGPGLVKCLRCAPEHYGTLKGVGLTAGLAASSRLHSRVDRWLSVSGFVAGALGQLRDRYGRGPEVVHAYVPDGLADIAARQPRPDFLPEDDGFLLFVGALGSHKGVNVLLEAYERLGRSVPLVMIGTPQSDTPSQLPPGATVVRDVPHRQVLAAMARAAIVVAPSLWPDPLPMTVSEAQLVGTPIVASAVGGISEMVRHEETGLLVTPGDVQGLADALRAMLDDRERRRAMGANGRAWARRFTREAVIPRIEQVFAEAVAARAGEGSRI